MSWQQIAVLVGFLLLLVVGLGGAVIDEWQAGRWRFNERLRKQSAVDDAARGIREQAAWAFQSMLDEARRHNGGR